MMQSMGKTEGFVAYARVLLDWYRNGKRWMSVTDEDKVPIEPMLLQALKDVADPRLRREIEAALTKEKG